MTKTYTVTLTLPDGRRKYYRGKTKREAEAKRDADKFAIRKGLLVDDHTTFGELADVWLGFKRNSQLHIRSIDTIEDTMRLYVLPVLGRMEVQAIKPIHIRNLMASVSEYSHSTQAKVSQATKNVLLLAVENGLVASSPFLESIKAEGYKPEEVEPLTDEQCARLLKDTEGTRVWLFLMVLRYTGLRKGEALGLVWSDIDFQQGTLTVNRSIVYPRGNKAGVINNECKTSAAHRTLPIPTQLKKALVLEREKAKSLYVFPSSRLGFQSESAFRRMWDIVRKRAPDLQAHPHQLRHTCITAWVAAGMDVKQVMYYAGHKTMDVTMEVYSHYQEQLRRKEGAERMEVSVANL